MKKSFCIPVLLILLVFIVTPGAGADTYKAEYTLSVVVGPASPWGKGAQRFAELVKNYSEGRITIKPCFSGELYGGKQTDEFRLLQKGVADFAFGSTINWSRAVQELNLFSLPFFFGDYKALDTVEQGDTGKMIFKILDERGIVALGWGENGFRELTNSKRPITKPADMEGLKIRVVASPIFIEIFKTLGAYPISTDWDEALKAFHLKTVDGQENPVTSIIIPYRLWHAHRFATIWHYTIDPLILAVNKGVWNKFSAQDRDLIRRAAEEATKWQKRAAREGLDPENTAIESLEKNGMKVSILTPEQIKLFKDRTKNVRDKWIKKLGTALVKMAESDIEKAERK